MTKRRLIHLGITVVLVMLGVIGMRALTASKPEMKKRKPTVPVPMVRTINVKTGPQAVHILGEGTVRPLREINLIPQVGGKVVYVSPALVNGGRFSKGDTLLRIDPVDYEIAVTLAEAKVKNSESLLRLAEEEAAAAREEWRLLHADDSKSEEKPPPLVAKEPQLAAATAGLKADRADLDRALLNLGRTVLKTPFAGRVSQEDVGIGQYVSPGQPLANLYSIEAAEIVVPLEDEDAFWFHIPGFTPGKNAGSSAAVRARIAGRELLWSGKVVRTEGKLDERTRTINVIVRVEKPYAKKPPLAVGLFVTVDIQGRTLPNAALIPRSALHEGNVVWVVDSDNRLRFREVEVGRVQGDEALVEAGLEDGEAVVTTLLKVVTDGMAVRTAPVKEEARL
ncbi:MAG: efflux RND transporter periplasmic adaptor subunit [Deltaproteobacteria bacterium]|nr:efflux RND transporter periplasmic adaptor subunit [Deltaproteobacteria bacterium]